MICPKCKVEMVEGKAIDSPGHDTRRCFYSPVVLTNETLKLIPCWKCPKCGHSDDGK